MKTNFLKKITTTFFGVFFVLALVCAGTAFSFSKVEEASADTDGKVSETLVLEDAETTTYYVSNAGSGTKDGSTSSNALAGANLTNVQALIDDVTGQDLVFVVQDQITISNGCTLTAHGNNVTFTPSGNITMFNLTVSESNKTFTFGGGEGTITFDGQDSTGLCFSGSFSGENASTCDLNILGNIIFKNFKHFIISASGFRNLTIGSSDGNGPQIVDSSMGAYVGSANLYILKFLNLVGDATIHGLKYKNISPRIEALGFLEVTTDTAESHDITINNLSII